MNTEASNENQSIVFTTIGKKLTSLSEQEIQRLIIEYNATYAIKLYYTQTIVKDYYRRKRYDQVICTFEENKPKQFIDYIVSPVVHKKLSYYKFYTKNHSDSKKRNTLIIYREEYCSFKKEIDGRYENISKVLLVKYIIPLNEEEIDDIGKVFTSISRYHVLAQRGCNSYRVQLFGKKYDKNYRSNIYKADNEHLKRWLKKRRICMNTILNDIFKRSHIEYMVKRNRQNHLML